MLRVRIEDGRSFVTFKSPVDHPTLKLREELETAVGDGERARHILERAGFRIWFRYEKYREEFALDEVVIAVDETPVGTFVEIEGSEAGHHGGRRSRSAAGRPTTSSIPIARCSCSICAERGVAGTHMTFGVSPSA